jgi:secreted PhoX family phosphatase
LPGPDLNALAKAKGATPFKRPENGNFRPGTRFAEFYFDETGDTDNRTSAAASGGFGALFKLVQSPSSDDGRISILYNGDQVHAGFDNLAFFSKDQLAAVEDAGDTLHTQRNALDSAWLFDVTADYSNPANQPIRFIAEARDPSATIDSGLSGSSGFTNDGDNEITGIHVSDGDPSVQGILGAKTPQPFRPDGHWRAFWTQQHGDNITWELIVR